MLCGLKTSLSPQTVLFKGRAQQLVFARELPARVRGGARAAVDHQRRLLRSQSGGPIQREGSGKMPLSLCAFPDAGCEGRSWGAFGGSSHDCPVRRRLFRSPPLAVEQRLMKDRTAFQHGNRQPVLPCGPRWSRPCLCQVFSPAGEVWLALGCSLSARTAASEKAHVK